MSHRRGGPPRRPPRQGVRKRSFHVFVEGARTEPQYLTYWWRLHRDRVALAIDDFHGGPAQLVERAIAFRKTELAAERKGQGARVDEVWCVFDIDEHLDVGRAVAAAIQGGINVAVSNPCIEVWFVWHYQDQSAHIHRHDAQRASRTLIQCEKTLTTHALDGLRGRYDDARARALAMEIEHARNRLAMDSNPSSSMWKLVDAIRSSGP